MNLTSLVVIVLRIAALKMLFNSGTVLLGSLLTRSAVTDDYIRQPVPWLLLAILIFCAVALWVLALPLARLVTHGISTEFSIGQLSLAHCYTVTFMGVGLLLAVERLGLVLQIFHGILRRAASGQEVVSYSGLSAAEVATHCIPFIAGVILVCKARAWGVMMSGKDAAEERLTQGGARF